MPRVVVSGGGEGSHGEIRTETQGERFRAFALRTHSLRGDQKSSPCDFNVGVRHEVSGDKAVCRPVWPQDSISRLLKKYFCEGIGV